MKNLILFGKSNRVQQVYSTCIGNASVFTPFCLRYLYRVAMLLCVLVLSIGQTWGM